MVKNPAPSTWSHKAAFNNKQTHMYVCAHLLSRFSSVPLSNPIDHSPLGVSVPGIFQARILEWVAISFWQREREREREREGDSCLSLIILMFSCIILPWLFPFYHLWICFFLKITVCSLFLFISPAILLIKLSLNLLKLTKYGPSSKVFNCSLMIFDSVEKYFL